jgi:hypothetical protein
MDLKILSLFLTGFIIPFFQFFLGCWKLRLVLWIATRLGCLRIFKFGLLTKGLITQIGNP